MDYQAIQNVEQVLNPLAAVAVFHLGVHRLRLGGQISDQCHPGWRDGQVDPATVACIALARYQLAPSSALIMRVRLGAGR